MTLNIWWNKVNNIKSRSFTNTKRSAFEEIGLIVKFIKLQKGKL